MIVQLSDVSLSIRTSIASGALGKGFVSLAAATILNAIANGFSFGFDIVDITGMPGGTVYPALRRLEEAGYLTSEWEKQRVAQSELRPRRKYYEITESGREVLAAAVKRYRLLDQAQFARLRDPKSSRA